MLPTWAIIIGVVGLIVLLLSARGIVSLAFGIAKVLFAICLIVAAALLIAHFLR